MKLVFLGTRGEIEKRTRRHRMHSSLLVSQKSARIVIDCGADWLGRAGNWDADAILLTHAHRDHAYGLSRGAPCPVYATADTWDRIDAYPIRDRRLIHERRPVDVGPLRIEAFAVEHSLRAPAVGYRVSSGKVFFYVPDVVAIPECGAALRGVALYIGDGATIARAIRRKRGNALIGHAAIRTQLDWCREAGVGAAIFTHCGSQIVGGDEDVVAPLVRRLGREHRVSARLAYDGLSVEL